MTLADLIARYRVEAKDTVQPYMCSDSVLIQYANEAEQEACRRASLLVDSSSVICSIDTIEALVDVDPRILSIRRVKCASSAYPIEPVAMADMDSMSPGWEDETGAPERYVIDYQTDSIRLYPAPTATETLTLTVTRLPMQDMEADEDTPEIRAEYQPALVQWTGRNNRTRRTSIGGLSINWSVLANATVTNLSRAVRELQP